MEKCWRFLYTRSEYGNLKLYKFSDYEHWDDEADNTINVISKEQGYFLTLDKLKEIFQAGLSIGGRNPGIESDAERVFNTWILTKK